MTINFNNVGQAFGLNDIPLSYIYGSGDYLLWPPSTPTPPDPSDYETQYTTFEFLESGTFGFKYVGEPGAAGILFGIQLLHLYIQLILT